MLKVPVETIIQKIKEQKGLSDAEIDLKIKAKLEQLAGLISREGAATILANELGVNIFPKTGGRCKLSEVVSGMRDVEVVGKITAVFEVREFSRAEGSGKVGNFMLGDESGTLRVVCWGSKADIFPQLTPGITVKVSSAYVRDNQGRVEIHCNDRTQVLLNPPGETVGEVKGAVTREAAVRKKIGELTENDANVEILGTTVQAFDPRFFEVCPQCQKRIKGTEGVFACAEHGQQTPDYSYVSNLILDDGSGKLRVVFFRNQAQKLVNKAHTEMLAFKENPGAYENVKTDLLGTILKIVGRVQRNSMSAELEFVSQLVFTNPNLEEELLR